LEAKGVLAKIRAGTQQRVDSREDRAESRQQRVDSREDRAESRQQRGQSRE
jgi:hypothetical protein